jgi:hypothetical protein
MDQHRATRPILIALIGLSVTLAFAPGALAQNIHIGPGGIDVGPPPPPPPPPPPRGGMMGPPPGPRDELQARMYELRGACEAGDRRACVRFGIMIGENRERVAEWRRSHPDYFFYER